MSDVDVVVTEEPEPEPEVEDTGDTVVVAPTVIVQPPPEPEVHEDHSGELAALASAVASLRAEVDELKAAAAAIAAAEAQALLDAQESELLAEEDAADAAIPEVEEVRANGGGIFDDDNRFWNG